MKRLSPLEDGRAIYETVDRTNQNGKFPWLPNLKLRRGAEWARGPLGHCVVKV
jgi:hypothetical protein